MKLNPDEFPPVTDYELRQLWVQHRDVDVRRLVLETHRAHELVEYCLGDVQRVQRDLYEKQYGLASVELEKIAERLLQEKVRLGAIGGIPVNVGRVKGR